MLLQLGRQPTTADVAAAADRVLIGTLTATLGRQPTEQEIVAARENEIRKKLAVQLGRPPTAAELKAAREASRRDRLQIGRGNGSPTVWRERWTTNGIREPGKFSPPHAPPRKV